MPLSEKITKGSRNIVLKLKHGCTEYWMRHEHEVIPNYLIPNDFLHMYPGAFTLKRSTSILRVGIKASISIAIMRRCHITQ